MPGLSGSPKPLRSVYLGTRLDWGGSPLEETVELPHIAPPNNTNLNYDTAISSKPLTPFTFSTADIWYLNRRYLNHRYLNQRYVDSRSLPLKGSSRNYQPHLFDIKRTRTYPSPLGAAPLALCNISPITHGPPALPRAPTADVQVVVKTHLSREQINLP